MNRGKAFVILAATFAMLIIVLGILCPQPLKAQATNAPKFQVDPYWPGPLPERWIMGTVGGVCVDNQDHVFVLNWRDLTNLELDAGQQAPPVMEFDSEGKMVNGWKDPNSLPRLLHGCFVDHENNVWLTGQEGSIVQKWSHDGSKLLLQLGEKGVFDTRDGTSKGAPLNSGKTAFYNSSGMVTDPKNGDIYVADSKGNWRVAVFNSKGEFQRQWALNTSPLEGKLLSFNVETREGLTGFRGQLHQDANLPRAVLEAYCITMDKEGSIYVCDRFDNRVQVYDRAGNYRKSIEIPFEQKSPSPRRLGGEWGTVRAVAFSPDPAQKYMYIVNEDNDRVEILDRVTGQILSNFGRVGHQLGDFTHAQSVAVDSKGNIYVGEAGVLGGEATTAGHRVQRFKVAP